MKAKNLQKKNLCSLVRFLCFFGKIKKKEKIKIREIEKKRKRNKEKFLFILVCGFVFVTTGRIRV